MTLSPITKHILIGAGLLFFLVILPVVIQLWIAGEVISARP